MNLVLKVLIAAIGGGLIGHVLGVSVTSIALSVMWGICVSMFFDRAA